MIDDGGRGFSLISTRRSAASGPDWFGERNGFALRRRAREDARSHLAMNRLKFLGRDSMTAHLVMMANRLLQRHRVIKLTVAPCLRCIIISWSMSLAACSDASKHLQIKDENGTPVSTAAINCSWTTYSLGFMSAFRPGHHHEYDGTSDINGRFDFFASKEPVFFEVTKPGYYPASSYFDPAKQPAGEFTITLRRVHLPQAMVGKEVRLRVPIGATRLEYDFLAGDCLPPLGNGVVADLEIEWTPGGRRW